MDLVLFRVHDQKLQCDDVLCELNSKFGEQVKEEDSSDDEVYVFVTFNFLTVAKTQKVFKLIEVVWLSSLGFHSLKTVTI